MAKDESKKFISFLLPAKSFWVMGFDRFLFGVCAITRMESPVRLFICVNLIIKAPAKSPFSAAVHNQEMLSIMMVSAPISSAHCSMLSNNASSKFSAYIDNASISTRKRLGENWYKFPISSV